MSARTLPILSGIVHWSKVFIIWLATF
jgi:hypothetical protein